MPNLSRRFGLSSGGFAFSGFAERARKQRTSAERAFGLGGGASRVLSGGANVRGMRSAWLVLGCFALLIDCGGTAFESAASGGGSQAGSAQAGSNAQGGSAQAGGAQGGNAQGGGAGVVVTGGTGGDLPNGGRAGSAAAGAPPMGGTGGSDQTGGASAGGASMGGASIGGASIGGSAGMAATSCPPSAPTAGDKCNEPLECWYGDDRRVACKSRYQCAAGQWASSGPSVMCAPIGDCSSTPSGFPVVGATCKTQGEECTFDGGASGTIYCRCNFCGSGNCPANMLDWACAGPPLTPCPEDLPNQGQPCDLKSSAMCTYGVACAGETMQCKAKVWTAVAGGCAN